jgi:hypothetical protein
MMDSQLLIEKQQKICDRYGAPYLACDLGLKVGVSSAVKSGVLPINGLRFAGERETCGFVHLGW